MPPAHHIHGPSASVQFLAGPPQTRHAKRTIRTRQTAPLPQRPRLPRKSIFRSNGAIIDTRSTTAQVSRPASRKIAIRFPGRWGYRYCWKVFPSGGDRTSRKARPISGRERTTTCQTNSAHASPRGTIHADVVQTAIQINALHQRRYGLPAEVPPLENCSPRERRPVNRSTHWAQQSTCQLPRPKVLHQGYKGQSYPNNR